MSTTFTFTTPQDATSLLKTMSEGSLLSILRQLPWSFLQPLISSSEDFDSLDQCRQVLKVLPSDFDNLFNKVNEETTSTIIKIVRDLYCVDDSDKRTTDQLIGHRARNCTSHVNDESGLMAVTQVLHRILMQESSFAAVRRVESCLDAIAVRLSKDREIKFVDRYARKDQVLSCLFSFLKT